MTSPAASTHFGSNPSTPTKPRVTGQAPSMAGGFEGSPTVTFSSSATPGTTSSPSQVDAPQPSFRNILASAASANATSALTEPQRQLYVRADPALLTCFDPVDKELYDLWAPKR